RKTIDYWKGLVQYGVRYQVVYVVGAVAGAYRVRNDLLPDVAQQSDRLAMDCDEESFAQKGIEFLELHAFGGTRRIRHVVYDYEGVPVILVDFRALRAIRAVFDRELVEAEPLLQQVQLRIVKAFEVDPSKTLPPRELSQPPDPYVR